MERLVSNRFDIQPNIPECFIFPPEKRPGKTIPSSETIPVIDLGGTTDGNRDRTQQVIKASQEFGFFQVINHGISSETIQNMLGVAKEFFEMPDEDKARLYSEDSKQACRLHTSIDYEKEEVHYWRDNLRHPCHPLEECMKLWPENPTKYREVVGIYSVEVRKLALRLLDILCEGLELEVGYFSDELSKVQLLSINHYPRCPDPSLTLGLPKHCDIYLITLLLQGDVKGLQVFKDGQWISVDPLPNAFVVNLGHQLQIISNGRLKSAEHRVVTNSRMARMTVANFICPSNDCVIEPAKPVVEASSTGPLYRAFQFKEFVSTYMANIGESEEAMKPFKVQTHMN